ncbi:hypothetical protein [Cohnella cellulosilytica]|uniref:Uncharacterized protein n=1 Tax=Cohnella cellulosilytica TaxID=986710 RepID=A0ABW2FH00_9BACL
MLTLQSEIDKLDSLLTVTVEHPDWFVDVRRTQRGIERRIALLERIQLAQMKNSRLAGRLNSEPKQNVIAPIVPQWQQADKGELV